VPFILASIKEKYYPAQAAQNGSAENLNANKNQEY
jgi:hypothetical protein